MFSSMWGYLYDGNFGVLSMVSIVIACYDQQDSKLLELQEISNRLLQ